VIPQRMAAPDVYHSGRSGMERGPVVRGLLNLVPASSCRRRQPSRREGQESGCLRIGLRAVAGVGKLARDPGERVDQGEDGAGTGPGRLAAQLR